ncbi:MAG: GTPase domain-containing protein [Flavobacteriaceae bacterium]|jgi:hypothetical protein|nr:GTPase domain-containing protein [Flavobacteriaceae bacterium]
MITHFLILPIVIWGAVVLGGLIFGAAISGMFKDPKRNKLGVLGMQFSGKTLFLNFLQGFDYTERATGREDYNEFRFKTSTGKEILIAKGEDYGGSKEYRTFYKTVVDRSDVLFFFLDISKYLNDVDYKRDCNSRFLFIDSLRIDSKTQEKKEVIVVATHRDLCSLSDSDIQKSFLKEVENKTYIKMVEKIVFINLHDKTLTKKFINKVFN